MVSLSISNESSSQTSVHSCSILILVSSMLMHALLIQHLSERQRISTNDLAPDNHNQTTLCSSPTVHKPITAILKSSLQIADTHH